MLGKPLSPHWRRMDLLVERNSQTDSSWSTR